MYGLVHYSEILNVVTAVIMTVHTDVAGVVSSHFFFRNSDVTHSPDRGWQKRPM